MSIEEALAADRIGAIETAAILYENEIKSGDSPLVVSLNLALLYWQATDVGLAAAKRLSPEFLGFAARRLPEVLEDAMRRFPRNNEARFWNEYIAWADLGAKLEINRCWELLREDPETMTPAMYIFAASEGREAQTEAHELLRVFGEDGTARARYITSVIEGVVARARLRQ